MQLDTLTGCGRHIGFPHHTLPCTHRAYLLVDNIRRSRSPVLLPLPITCMNSLDNNDDTFRVCDQFFDAADVLTYNLHGDCHRFQ